MEAWQAFLALDAGNVTLLAFDGTILERNADERSLRRSLSPLHLHRGAVLKYVSADTWQTFSEDAQQPWGIVQVEGMVEGTMADREGPHLLTANLHNMFMKVAWNPRCGTYTVCLVTAGYIKNLMSDENYVRWGQDVEALVAGASVTALVGQLYRLAERVPGWDYCPELTSDKGELSGFGYL
ncbi:hypothetical protein ONE63_001332 [Megalurothrips usitatus]|uniref:Uncharacterized protein n=1 Tax=Megalurothrips usitatus TaxID=439358 RepID=A0AAV7XEW5_9NEOP|nr:hypothetical protein ONE63_001332 [Megalurothrips usitatus]